MWDKLKLTYEGTDKVKETRINILVTQYEKFPMEAGESISQMANHTAVVARHGWRGCSMPYND
ncbi:hypothetical protein Taro_036922 [Colocasia esculenta]|uniref:Uncharacterized protein n=1 Tax=Colocasia esculenta TaxID=4460 RepID=A0A843W871_COLES|nr:hypothetical protein [Colocasia esculenta]